MAQSRERSIVNNSTSKQQFAFPKAQRFVSPKKPTAAFGYEIKGYFSDQKGQGIGFGKKESRFGYEEFKKEQRGIGKIASPEHVNNLSTKMRTFSYSFGVSRSAMKKIHVDEILKKKDENLPGPDRYLEKDGFGQTSGSVSYSLRKKLGAFERQLGRESRLPGPGYYQANDLVGKGLSTSNMKSAVQSSFPKSTDRFRPPKQQSPPSTTYQVKDGLNQNFNSQRTYMGSTRFGTNTKNFMDQNWHLDRANNQPGPGQYTSFSDFAGAQ